LKFYNKAGVTFQEENKESISCANNLDDIGQVYKEQGKLKEAL